MNPKMPANVIEFAGLDDIVYSFYNDVPIGGYANADIIENQIIDIIFQEFDSYGDIPLLPISYVYTASIGGFAKASMAAAYVSHYFVNTMTDSRPILAVQNLMKTILFGLY